MDPNAISRVLQGILTGIGFLGAGVILRDSNGHVTGLTTAIFGVEFSGGAGLPTFGLHLAQEFEKLRLSSITILASWILMLSGVPRPAQ